ncbi:MAG: DUF2846 domain-containing protein [Gallionella sp.]
MKTITLLLTWRFNIRQLLTFSLCINAAFILAGCATGLVHVALSKLEAPSAGQASIFVIRPAYLSYAARDLTIKVDNTKIADLVNLSYTSFLIPQGNLNLSSEGGFFSWPRRELALKVEAGKTYYLKWVAKETASSALMMYLFPIMDMDALHWEVISQERAQPLLQGIHYVKPVIPENFLMK